MLDRLFLRQKSQEQTLSIQDLKVLADKSVNSVLQGEHAQKKAGSGEKFWQFRDYTVGDRPQDIDWRQSAKTDSVFIREKERQTPQNIIFWTSSHKSMRFKSSYAEHSKADIAKILTLTLGILTTRAGENISYFGSKRSGRSENTLEHLSHKLLEAAPNYSLPNATSFKLPKNSYLFQVGDFLDPLDTIEKSIQYFDKRCSSAFIIQILDPQELNLGYDGRVLFHNDTMKERVENVSSIRNDYQKRIREHNEHLKQICKNHRWHYVLHRTDIAVKDTLINIWGKMQSYNNRGY